MPSARHHQYLALTFDTGALEQAGARVVVPEKPMDQQGANWAQIVTITTSFITALLSIVVISRQV